MHVRLISAVAWPIERWRWRWRWRWRCHSLNFSNTLEPPQTLFSSSKIPFYLEKLLRKVQENTEFNVLIMWIFTDAAIFSTFFPIQIHMLQTTHTNTPIHFHLHFLLTRDFLVKHVCVEKWANRRGNISQQKSQIKINKICWFFFWRSARLMLFTFAKNDIHECGMCGRWLRGRVTAFRFTAKRLVYFVRPKRVTFTYWCIGVVFV